MLEDLKNNHYFHAALIGAAAYTITRNKTSSVVVSLVAAYYMVNFGHGLPK
jgi:hypothetical protein